MLLQYDDMHERIMSKVRHESADIRLYHKNLITLELHVCMCVCVCACQNIRNPQKFDACKLKITKQKMN